MRVAVLEDQMLTREGIVRTLTMSGVEVVAAVGDVPALMVSLALDSPEAAVLDVRLPPTFTTEGLAAAEEIKRSYPSVAVLILSQHVEAQFATGLLEQVDGGIGYLLKDRILEPATLLDALRRVIAGQCVLDPSMVADLMRRRTRVSVLDELTSRELDVLQGIAEGLTNGAVGERLHISDRTVEVHAQRVFDKLGLHENPSVNKRVLAAVRYLSATS